MKKTIIKKPSSSKFAKYLTFDSYVKYCVRVGVDPVNALQWDIINALRVGRQMQNSQPDFK